MKTVELSVEYRNSLTQDIEYAVLFIGIMSRRFLYLRKSSITGSKADEVSYVKIAKADTEKAINACSLANPDEMRVMSVTTELGIFDSRIKRLSDDDPIVASITEAIRELHANIV